MLNARIKSMIFPRQFMFHHPPTLSPLLSLSSLLPPIGSVRLAPNTDCMDRRRERYVVNRVARVHVAARAVFTKVPVEMPRAAQTLHPAAGQASQSSGKA